MCVVMVEEGGGWKVIQSRVSNSDGSTLIRTSVLLGQHPASAVSFVRSCCFSLSQMVIPGEHPSGSAL